MKLLTLGRLELTESAFKRSKPLVLLTYLSLEGKQSREHLAELFWPSGDMRKSRNNLSRTLSDLRSHVPESFKADDSCVWSSLKTDATVFQEALAANDYAKAAAIYAGSFLEGSTSKWSVEVEEWIYDQRERLAQSAQGALLELAEQAARDLSQDALKRARAAFRLAEPQPEMLARFHTLFQTQDRSLAREVQDLARGYGIRLEFDSAESTLSPPPISDTDATTHPSQAVLSERELEAPLPVPQATAHNLPLRGTSFVGRDLELSEILHQLAQPVCRLLCLTGIGGVGKSRLAIQAAYELLRAAHYRGIYYIKLDSLNTAELIPSTIADALGLQLSSKDDLAEQLAHAIGDKALLLILDNFEHLMNGATLIPKMLETCPNLKVLVTSRERLELEEEWVFPVEGLALPEENTQPADAQYFDAVRLFTQRAYQAQMTFELSAEDVPHVLKLCRLVAGSPLALELAAVWVTVMSLKTLAQEIETNLDVLSASSKNRSERHKNLRAVFENSWNLLNPKEQDALKKLSVFRGGFTREAAANVAGASINILASFVNKSLLRSLPNKRYDRHPLLSQYTQEKLLEDASEHERLQERHFEFFLALAEKARPHLNGPEQKEWLERFEQDHDNFRMALTWALKHNNSEKALSLSGILGWFWNTLGYYSEGREWLNKALALPNKPLMPARALTLSSAGWMAMQQDDYEIAQAYMNESVSIYKNLGEVERVADLLNNLSAIAYYSGDYATSAKQLEEALEVYRRSDNKRGMASVLGNLGGLASESGDREKAYLLRVESLKISRDRRR